MLLSKERSDNGLPTLPNWVLLSCFGCVLSVLVKINFLGAQIAQDRYPKSDTISSVHKLPLQPFASHTQPFTCPACGLYWACLPRLPASSARVVLEQKVFAWFEWFFTQGTPHLLACALGLIREKLKKEKAVHVRLLDGMIKRVEHYELTKASLCLLVDLLVSLDLSPAL